MMVSQGSIYQERLVDVKGTNEIKRQGAREKMEEARSRNVHGSF